ncbi:MAG: hypothetical protein SPG10_02270 [Enterocloster clostridioformis]|uniref:hypothetical protein n=1 Tax=Enterocloster clostridioformis TaxID=1531 RepID=UPI0026ECBEC4|nr:hypothetical protein [Enterocloster clostridioformis]MDY5475782.1 hypothetical protein [Enterocloster clostridioformis]
MIQELNASIQNSHRCLSMAAQAIPAYVVLGMDYPHHIPAEGISQHGQNHGAFPFMGFAAGAVFSLYKTISGGTDGFP